MRRFKKYILEQIGSTQTSETHSWTVEHPQEAWAKLPSDEHRAKVSELHQQGRLHDDGHLHGWKPGTGPLFGRDFHGRTNEDYRKMHKTVFDNLSKRGDLDRATAMQYAKDYTYGMRRRAHAEGQQAHSNAMVEVRRARAEADARRQQAEINARNVSGHEEQAFYERNARGLHDLAMRGSDIVHHHYSTDDSPESLTPEARKHLETIRGISRRAAHATVWGGMRRAGREFARDASEHWNSRFTGITPQQAGLRHAHEVLPSLLRPAPLRHALERMSQTPDLRHYPSDDSTGPDTQRHRAIMSRSYAHGSHSYFSFHHVPNVDDNIHVRGSAHITGMPTTLPRGYGAMHSSVRHLHPHPVPEGRELHHHEYEDIIAPLFSIASHPRIPANAKHDALGSVKQPNPAGHEGAWGGPDVPSERRAETHNALRPYVQHGSRFIHGIQGITDRDRGLLHHYFEAQLRHHYLAAIAHPGKFNEHHVGKAAQEAEREARERARREQSSRQQGGQQSSGGSSQGGQRRRRRGEWPHAEKPHEILGVPENPTMDQVRLAHRKLMVTHHPDALEDLGWHEVWQRIDLKSHDEHHAKKRKISQKISDARRQFGQSYIPRELIKELEDHKAAGDSIAQTHFESPAGLEIRKRRSEEREQAVQKWQKIQDAHDHFKSRLQESLFKTMLEWTAKKRKKNK